MVEFQKCTNEKSVDCLLKLSPAIRGGLVEWTVYKDKSLCKDYEKQEDKNFSEIMSENNKHDLSADWDTFNKFLLLKDSSIKVAYFNHKLEGRESLTLTLAGPVVCGEKTGLYLYFNRNNKGKWNSELMTEGFGF